MPLRVAPIDSALLSLVQLIQPASRSAVLDEVRGTFLKALTATEINRQLDRLEEDQFLLRTASGDLVVAPKSYDLVRRSLSAKQRDKARLLFLNAQRYK
jgi:hypothetical protein